MPISVKPSQLECKQYFKEVFNDLNTKFAPGLKNNLVPNSSCGIRIEIDTKKPRILYYGDPEIIDTLERAAAGVCKETQVYKWYRDLIEYLQEKCVGWKAIDELVEKVLAIKIELRNYYDSSCKGCTCEVCKENLKQVLEGLPERVIENGYFCARTNTIKLFTQSMKLVTSGDVREFLVLFWSTLAHETFHAYHYQACLCNGKNPSYWEDWEDSYPEKEFNEEVGQEKSILDWLQPRRPLSKKRIVKESLASFYEYHVCKYGMLYQDRNFDRTLVSKYREALVNEWFANSPDTWPYSGAISFAKTDSGILGCLFREVLEKSLDDWEPAYELIIKNWSNDPEIKNEIIRRRKIHFNTPKGKLVLEE